MSDKDTFTGQDMFRDPIIVQRHANGSVVIGQPGEFRGTDEAVTISMNADTARAFAAWVLANAAEGATS